MFFLLATAAALSLNPGQFPIEIPAASCPKDTPITCTNSTPVEDTCCFESPGGVMLQTQFWDYYPPIGANDSFTLHGLWPDNCDGTYEQFCDSSLDISKGEVKKILVDQYKDTQLFEKIQKVWKNFNGDDESLWVHEFNKHATCIKTIRPKCYGSSFQNDQNIYDFFKVAVGLYEKYPTFDFLQEKGITPSNEKTYTKQEISDALSSNFDGHEVYFKCNKYQALQEVWYFHHLRGSLLSEDFVPIPAMVRSNCPNSGIKFLPKGKFSPPPGQPPKDPSGRRGYVRLSDHSGCLISNGQHYDYGTCATFRLTDSHFGGKNLRSSKGVCGFNAGKQLTCNSRMSATKYQFQFDKETRQIGYGGQFKWCFDESDKHGHGKYIQTPLKLASGDCESFYLTLN